MDEFKDLEALKGMYPKENEEIKKQNLSIQAFGKRLYKDQTVYEYLLEFLLIFCSPKIKNEEADGSVIHTGEFKFHKNTEELTYYANPRIGLKRFIFFENSKLEGRFQIDRENYQDIVELIENAIMHCDEKREVVKIIQEAFYGFSAVLRSRSWFAQSLLPISPELIFCETIGNKGVRKKLNSSIPPNDTEKKFELTRHSFMARGGELYYLHILQGLEADSSIREPLERRLYQLVHAVDGLGELGAFIQNEWEKTKEISREKQIQEYACDYIPNGYKRRAPYTCRELVNLLSTTMNELDKMEYLGKGIMLQIFRMMHEQACIRTNKPKIPLWLLDVSKENKKIRMLASQSFQNFMEVIMEANNVGLENVDEDFGKQYKNRKQDNFELKLMEDAKKNTVGMVKFIGKEIQFIIPARGGNERMTLSEELITFLVTALLKPMEKVTVDTFLQKMYEHFGMVVGGTQAVKYCARYNIKQNYEVEFKENEEGFIRLLRNCGYVRELSDATSIVMNPYEGNE